MKKNYYDTKRVSNFWNNNYTKYESNVDKNWNLSLDEYLNKIEWYLRNIIFSLQNSDTWKIQLTIAINFISSKDSEEELVMHSSKIKIYIKCLSYSEVNDVIKKVISFKIPGWFRNTNERKCFLFDSVQLIYYKCHKVNFKSGGSYIDSPD